MRRWEVVRRDGTVRLFEFDSGNDSMLEIMPSESLKVVNHSPCGFEFGYGGSGPAQLALAILLRYYGKGKRMAGVAEWQHQSFKWAFVATAPDGGFVISETEIGEWLAKEGRK